MKRPSVSPAGVGEAEDALGRTSAAMATAKGSLDSLDQEIADQSTLVSQHDLEQGRLDGRVNAAESRRAATQVELERSRNALEEAEKRREDARAELLEIEGADGSVSEDGELAAAVDAAEASVAALQAEVETLRDELHASERERDALAARTGALSLAVDQKDGSGAIVGARGIRGLVAEHMQVRAGYEAAIAAALGTLADAVLADDRDAGARRPRVGAVRRRGQGRDRGGRRRRSEGSRRAAGRSRGRIRSRHRARRRAGTPGTRRRRRRPRRRASRLARALCARSAT